jgi:hypothetical protein
MGKNSIFITLLMILLPIISMLVGYYIGIQDTDTFNCYRAGGIPIKLDRNAETYYICWNRSIDSRVLSDDFFIEGVKFEIIGGINIDNTDTND